MNEEKLVKRIKVHTLIAMIAGGIAVISAMLQYFILMPFGIVTTESAGLGIFLFTQFPFAVIAGVMGFVAFFYGMRNSTWRAGRVIMLVVAVMIIVVFVLPLLSGLIMSGLVPVRA